MDSPNNFGIRKREVIGEIKSMVDKVCPDRVSCADILVLAAREAVAVTKGPTIRVPLGRRDSTVAYTRDDASIFHLPPPDTFVARSLGYLDNLDVGLNDEEKVALLGKNKLITILLIHTIILILIEIVFCNDIFVCLFVSGAHTLGISRCTSIQERIDFPGIPDIDKAFVNKLRKLCPKGAPSNKNTSLANDRTPYIFDRDYFIGSTGGRGLLVTDDVGSDRFTVTYVGKFIQDPDYFFNVFSSAFIKLSTSQILTGNAGEIRKQCDKLNGAR